MAQGMLAGSTSYENQSIVEIRKDITIWISYIDEIQQKLDEISKDLIASNYWDTIPFDFRYVLESSKMCFRTYKEDLIAVLKAIDDDAITTRDVNLLRNIGITARDKNIEYGKYWHSSNEDYWKQYGEANFEKVNELYCEGRNTFATLVDAANASYRLEHYIKNVPIYQNTLSMQDLKGVNIQVQQGSVGSTQNQIIKQELDSDDIEKIMNKVLESTNSSFAEKDLGDSYIPLVENTKEILLMLREKRDVIEVKKKYFDIKAIAEGAVGSLIAAGILAMM